MLKTFPIDFIRQAFEQKLFEEHKKNPHLFGGKDQVNIFSFYEQLKTQDQVDRFVERYRDLSDQQNRSGLLLNGVLVAPENPTITNLYSSTIIPMTWTCSMRCMLADRDNGIITINNLIKELKGRKVDIAQLNCVDDLGNKYTEPFMVGTVGQGDGEPTLKNGDYIGDISNNTIMGLIHNLIDNGVVVDYSNVEYLYCGDAQVKHIKVLKQIEEELSLLVYDYETVTRTGDRTITIQGVYNGKLYESDIKRTTTTLFIYGDETVELELNGGVASCVYNDQTNITTVTIVFRTPRDIDEYVDNYSYFLLEDVMSFAYEFDFINDDGTINEIIFPPQHDGFEKYKVSFSFDAIRCDEPRNLNEKEYCELSFGGSATLVNSGIKLGNDLLKVSFSKTKIVGAVESYANNIHYLEPLEMPSGNSANAKINQLMSNNFLSNSHTDALNINTQYTFILDDSVELLSQWFDYARYGTQGLTIDDISPNIIYTVKEYWCSWGNYSVKTYLGKIIESIDIENTESDTLTLSVSFQVQGENN